MAGIDFTDSVWGANQQFDKGKSYLVKAPSGTGKSSFVAFLYGLRSDYNGTISFDNKALNKMSLGDWAKVRQHHLSLVHQELRLFPLLTAWENIQIKGKLTGSTNRSEVQSMADQLGIGDKLSQKCGKLSLGQQQRVAIIRALIQPFDFLLLDEPFSHLDDANIAKSRTLIEAACEKNNAALILTSLGDPYDFNYDIQLAL